MLSANAGSYEINKKKSFGVTVKNLLNKEEINNKIIKDNINILDTFSDRKKILIDNYDLIIFFPGGIGTLDEFTEVMNLLKTESIVKNNIILYGYKYWTSLISWFNFNEITFPDEFIDCIIDSVDEFNEFYSKINLNKSIDTSITTEEIKNYEPIFNKKTVFNPIDDIDELINLMFNKQDMLNNFSLKNIKYNEEIKDKLKKIKNESFNDTESDENINKENLKMVDFKSNDEEEDEDFDDDEIIIEIVYDNSSSSENASKSDNDDILIDPINFISDSDSDSDDN